MTTDRMVPAIDVPELQGLVQAIEPAALFLPSRLLRRIIKRDRGVPGFGLLVPHRRSLVISRDRLLGMMEPEELGRTSEQDLPPTLILIACPNPATLAATPREATLIKFWRTLFHTQIHVALEKRFPSTGNGPLIRDRIEPIGQTEFAEIRSVLQKEDYLLPPQDDREVYVEFAALYLELRYFARPLLPYYFPGLDQPDRVDQLLAHDLDADALFAATRLAGAPDPVAPEETGPDDEEGPTLLANAPAPPEKPNCRLLKKWKKLAQRAGARGNVVRAAIARRLAAEVAPPKQVEEFRAGARTELERLAQRLHAALGLPNQDAVPWRKALTPLLKPATQGFWPVEARLLYDLQKVCIDHERELYAVELVEWGLSLGRRPLKRPVPCQRQVLKLRHLRSAARRLCAARIADKDRSRLSGLLQDALHHCEDQLRGKFRPLLQNTLVEVGLMPRNLPERVAQNKLVEELLDRISDSGFFSLGDLRDALSRNSLKLPDLGQPSEDQPGADAGWWRRLQETGRAFRRGLGKFFLGDQLIRADRHLALALDGVYRRGEIYLRWLQRLSSVPFATALGRFLTLFLVLPLGIAFVSLEGLQHIVGPLSRFSAGVEVDLLYPEVPVPLPGTPYPLKVSVPLVAAAVFVFGLLHVAGFRRLVGWTLLNLFRGLRRLLVDLPAQVLQLPAVRALLESRPFALLLRHVFKPLLVTAPAYLVLRECAVQGVPLAAGTGAVFAVVSLFLNTRLGRDVEELLTDWLVRLWQRLSFALLPALFHVILAFFKQLVEGVDRWLYRVDEWLRFRKGEGRLAMLYKPVLGVFWFWITYVVRVCVNLFIEPTINPIKHFPVVTVAGKLLGPFYPLVSHQIHAQLMPLGRVVAFTAAGITVLFMPGFFGFLVWELKENWRLYEANRPRQLGPVLIGRHGETMTRLLRPGFHSGTIPKLWAKLRRAERAALRGRSRATARKRHEALHHVEESLRHFIERELLFLLNECGCLDNIHLTLGEIRLGTNRIVVAIGRPGPAQGDLKLTFEELEGWLVAGIAQPGWSATLVGAPRHALETALAGLYKKAGVDLVRAQLDAVLGSASLNYAVVAEGLLLRVRADGEAEAVCRLTEGPAVSLRVLNGPWPAAVPALPLTKLLYKKMPLPWADWVAGWEAGPGSAKLLASFQDLAPLLPTSVTPEWAHRLV